MDLNDSSLEAEVSSIKEDLESVQFSK
jgi:hypothetical protein